jgi:hypothetical protein
MQRKVTSLTEGRSVIKFDRVAIDAGADAGKARTFISFWHLLYETPLAGPAGDSVCILPVNVQVMTFTDPR